MAAPADMNCSIKAVAVYKFLNEFNNLEYIVKDKFSQITVKATASEKNKLYFYHGGLAGKVAIDYNVETLNYQEIQFNVNEKFKHFTLNQVIKILQNSDLKKYFPENINSMLKANNQIEFLGSIKRLINMRNKLAHELINLNFKDRDYIELLPIPIIEEKLKIIFDINYAEADQIQIIYSNIVYINSLIEEITI